ncbi:potassium channel family protein [Sinobacterium caligoides]|nr:potassium channel family protein [Sinobacterium caligoides]
MNRHHNFIYLTLSLVFTLLVSALFPYVENEVGIGAYGLKAMLLATFAVTLVSLRFGQYWRPFIAVLIAVYISLAIVQYLLLMQEREYLFLSVLLVFFIGTAYGTARQVLFSGHVDLNEVVGSIAIFLLVGLIWAVFYLLIMEASPDAFNGLEQNSWVANFSDAAYFSFVTLTTLGYGDISPATDFARVVVYLEAIFGVFYMAVVVASLINANQNQTKDQ